MEVLCLRLEAPLMSFGAPIIDNLGRVQPFPAASMLTGLLANALGWRHEDGDAMNDLQSRLQFASRIDRLGKEVVDYQTVDLGQDFMTDTGWTSWGKREDRAGALATRTGTHIRYRHYRADASVVVSLSLGQSGRSPNLNGVEDALLKPVRPLFLGRKTCIPSRPILIGHYTVPSLIDGLHSVPAEGARRLQVQWPADEPGPEQNTVVSITDERDWINQVHGGERLVRYGEIVL